VAVYSIANDNILFILCNTKSVLSTGHQKFTRSPNHTPVAMSLLRFALRNHALRALPFVPLSRTSIRAWRTSLQQRHYATKGKTKSTSKLIPGSKQPITDETALAEYKKTETSMMSAVDWFRKECQGLETRASGRVTPALLSPVRVKLADREYRLEEIATVGVRDGSLLVITIFDEKVSYGLTCCFLELTCSSRR
jgi:ribosome recycling factor